jgi:hypothetical protein
MPQEPSGHQESCGVRSSPRRQDRGQNLSPFPSLDGISPRTTMAVANAGSGQGLSNTHWRDVVAKLESADGCTCRCRTSGSYVADSPINQSPSASSQTQSPVCRVAISRCMFCTLGSPQKLHGNRQKPTVNATLICTSANAAPLAKIVSFWISFQTFDLHLGQQGTSLTPEIVSA